VRAPTHQRHACGAQVNGGALLVPAGVYRLTRRFTIKQAVLLKGAGRDATKLYFPHSLSELYGNRYAEVCALRLEALHEGHRGPLHSLGSAARWCCSRQCGQARG
jgi:hypothetical protein